MDFLGSCAARRGLSTPADPSPFDTLHGWPELELKILMDISCMCRHVVGTISDCKVTNLSQRMQHPCHFSSSLWQIILCIYFTLHRCRRQYMFCRSPLHFSSLPISCASRWPGGCRHRGVRRDGHCYCQNSPPHGCVEIGTRELCCWRFLRTSAQTFSTLNHVSYFCCTRRVQSCPAYLHWLRTFSHVENNVFPRPRA